MGENNPLKAVAAADEKADISLWWGDDQARYVLNKNVWNMGEKEKKY